mgnify:CR=1 FL=1
MVGLSTMVGALRLPTLPLNILSPDRRAGKRMRTRVVGGGEIAMVGALRFPPTSQYPEP